ncbi:MAG: HAMP domain-containing histidine kinase, partial [Clostridia bacterium]|nr:HAMP domain-containing histidine kinase [Clostridia bacterium]
LLIFFSYNQIDEITKQQKKDTFMFQSEQIFSFISEHKDEFFIEKDESIYSDLTNLVKKLSLNSNSYIWVTNGNGELISNSRDNVDERFFTYNELLNSYVFTKTDYYQAFLESNQDMKECSIFSDEIKNKDEVSVSYVYHYNLLVFNKYPPLEVDILIYLHTSVIEMNLLKKQILLSFLFPFIMALSIGTILVGLISVRVSKPLIQLNTVANSVRSGDYKSRAFKTKRKDELGQLADNFNKMIDEIDKLDKSRLSFISDMSHELRTPMTTINGFISGILDGTIDYDSQSYYLNLVKDEVNRLNRLINNLLLLSKIESEEVELIRTDFDINTVITQTVANMENMLKEKNLNLDIRFDEKITYVNANEDDIERVMFNLIHNAIKFSEKRGHIRIYTKVRKKVTVYVEDDGIGINEGELLSIWNRFYKADKSRSADKTGTGLGLSIVQKIINNHNETVSVESEPGKGSRFFFTLKISENL